MSLVDTYAKTVKGTPRCVQCGDFIEDTLSPAEEKEFLCSGLCPKCFKEAMEQQIRDPGPLRTKVELTMDNWATILGLVRREIRNRNAFGPEILKGRDITDLRIIEDAIIDMAFEKTKGGEDDKA